MLIFNKKIFYSLARKNKNILEVTQTKMNNPEDFEWLKKYSTCFVVDSNDVQVLDNPNDFYLFLKVETNSLFFIYLKSIKLITFVPIKGKTFLLKETNITFVTLHRNWTFREGSSNVAFRHLFEFLLWKYEFSSNIDKKHRQNTARKHTGTS